MNYRRIYDALIAKRRLAQPDGYCERHHVVPRSLGGDDSSENLVRLTAREHFIAHWLLAKIHGGPMWLALVRMKNRRHGPGYMNSRAYASARAQWAAWSSANQRGAGHWAHGKQSPYKGKKRPELAGVNNGNFGRKRTPGQIAAVVAANLGKKRSPETCQKISQAQRGQKNHSFGKSLSESHREKVRLAMKGRRLTAEHKANIGAALRGRVVSAETRAKLSKAHRARWAKEHG